MKRFLKEHGWYTSMIIGIGLLMTTVIMDGELFVGQTIAASVLIILSLVLEGATKKW